MSLLRRPAGLLVRVLASLALVGAASARAEPLSQAEALALAFPGAKLERKEHFLTDAQREQVKRLAGTEQRSRFVVSYEARSGAELVGVAFFDTHVVRTQPETAMVAVSPKGVVQRVEVVQFREPAEYAAPDRWKKQLEGQPLDDGLSLKGHVRPLSGASLTAQALVDASRRALALHRVLYGPP